MKDLADRLALDEVFAFLAPGSALLGGVIALWIDPAVVPLSLRAILKQSTVLVAALLLAAYTCGHVLTLWTEAGTDHYMRLALLRAAWPDQHPWRHRVLAFFHWMPLLKPTEFIVDAQIRIAESLGRLGERAAVNNPLRLLSLYRTVVSGRPGLQEGSLIQAADSAHRRLVFVLGTALALLSVSLQALLRLPFSFVCHAKQPPRLAPELLAIVGLGGVAASFALRWAAGRWWRQELWLTCAITESDLTNRASPAPGQANA